MCRTKFVKSEPLPTLPGNELGIAAGTHVVKVEALGFTGKVKPCRILAEKEFPPKAIVFGSKVCPPNVTLSNPPRNICPISTGGEDPGANGGVKGEHQSKHPMPPKPEMLVLGPVKRKPTLSPEPSLAETKSVDCLILKMETLSA
jgi:hypothetical protein